MKERKNTRDSIARRTYTHSFGYSLVNCVHCNTRVVCGWKKVEIEADWNILNRIYHWQYISVYYIHKNDVYYVIHLLLNMHDKSWICGNRLADLICLEVSVVWVAAKEGKQHIILFICCIRVSFVIYHDALGCLLHQDVFSFELSVCKHALPWLYLLHHSKRNEIRRNPTLNGVNAFSISIFTKSK